MPNIAIYAGKEYAGHYIRRKEVFRWIIIGYTRHYGRKDIASGVVGRFCFKIDGPLRETNGLYGSLSINSFSFRPEWKKVLRGERIPLEDAIVWIEGP